MKYNVMNVFSLPYHIPMQTLLDIRTATLAFLNKSSFDFDNKRDTKGAFCHDNRYFLVFHNDGVKISVYLNKTKKVKNTVNKSTSKKDYDLLAVLPLEDNNNPDSFKLPLSFPHLFILTDFITERTGIFFDNMFCPETLSHECAEDEFENDFYWLKDQKDNIINGINALSKACQTFSFDINHPFDGFRTSLWEYNKKTMFCNENYMFVIDSDNNGIKVLVTNRIIDVYTDCDFYDVLSANGLDFILDLDKAETNLFLKINSKKEIEFFNPLYFSAFNFDVKTLQSSLSEKHPFVSSWKECEKESDDDNLMFEIEDEEE